MRQLKVQITREPIDDDFAGVISWLEAAGLTLVNPSCNTVTYFDEAAPDQFKTTAETVLNQLANGERGNVQMWFGVGSDIFISWTELEMWIFLNGPDLADRRKMLHAVLDGFAEICDGTGFGWEIRIFKDYVGA